MNALLLSAWDDFSNWVTLGWNQTTFVIVVCVFGICGLLAFLSFFKGNFNKGKSIKWFKLVVALLMFALLAVVSAAKYA